MLAIGRSADQSVKALGPDGALRRQRFSQDTAQFLVDRSVALAKWNRARTRILCIQFFGDQAIPATPLRWLRTGTRYSYREPTDTGSVWTHKRLPYGAVDAESGYVEAPEVLESYMRALFLEVPLSITIEDEPPTRRRAAVISIDVSRHRPAPRIAELKKAA